MKPYTKAQNRWRFKSRETGYEHRHAALELYWELYGDPISDWYSPSEVSAEELLMIWLGSSSYLDPTAEPLFGPGMVRIAWYIEGDLKVERAPYEATTWGKWDDDFLHWLTTPINEVTSERVNWLRLPVVDKLWRRPGRGGQRRVRSAGHRLEAIAVPALHAYPVPAGRLGSRWRPVPASHDRSLGMTTPRLNGHANGWMAPLLLDAEAR
jgi:hypothetical protein